MTNLLIISNQCDTDFKMINEGISERNIGLYGNLAKHWKSKVFWYSCRDSCLYEIENGKKKCVKRKPILFGLFRALPNVAIVIGYPHGLVNKGLFRICA